MSVTVHHGDCLEVLPTLEADSLDGCATDPPYHLTSIVKRFGADNAAPAKSNGQTGVYGRASAGFMGQKWDGGDVAFRSETWAEVFRVLKPGAHLLAFGGTRTYHRMACAIEDAGFEIRDQIAWLYGSGFPKSHDVAKAIDKRRSEDIEPVRRVCRFVRSSMDVQGIKSHQLVAYFGGCHPRLIDHWAARDTDSQPALPTNKQWLVLKDALGLSDDMDGEVVRLNARKGDWSDRYNGAAIVGEIEGDPGGFAGERFTTRDNKIRALSEVAKAYDGWGTALKPALEPIVVARKPLVGTVAANVLAHGTGALNIDGCRVETSEADQAYIAERITGFNSSRSIGGNGILRGGETMDRSAHDPSKGRWPANVVHDGSEEVEAAFRAFGESKSGQPRDDRGTGGIWSPSSGKPAGPQHGDSGSASRFFYCAKADAGDRLGSKHPTVKPVGLMRWLVRLICPPGGTILDPFAGTGTTGMACLAEGFNAVLIEREEAYVADIRKRLAHVEGADTPLFGAAADA